MSPYLFSLMPLFWLCIIHYSALDDIYFVVTTDHENKHENKQDEISSGEPAENEEVC